MFYCFYNYYPFSVPKHLRRFVQFPCNFSELWFVFNRKFLCDFRNLLIICPFLSLPLSFYHFVSFSLLLPISLDTSTKTSNIIQLEKVVFHAFFCLFFYRTNSPHFVGWVCSDFQHQFAHQGNMKIQRYYLVGNFKSTLP